MKKRNYIYPNVISDTASLLDLYRQSHGGSQTPMADALKEYAHSDTLEYDRARFLAAARRLRWNVHKVRGHVYENGYFVW